MGKDALRQQGLIPEFDGTRSEPDETGPERKAREDRLKRDKAQKLAWIRSIWESSKLIANSPVSAYLASRGIFNWPSALRYHSNLKHSDTGQFFGCMVGAVTRWPDREVVGIHRTFLQTGGSGKANIHSPKKMAGECKGGAVRLAPVTDRLGLGEGIETSLSVQQSSGVPMWACLSTSGLKAVIVPDTVKEILIFADGDDPGLKAAQETAKRFINNGKSVRIVPAPPGSDWNDCLNISPPELDINNG